MLRTLMASLIGIGLAATAAGAMAQSRYVQTQPRFSQMDRGHFDNDRDRDRGREQAQGPERRQDSNGRFGLDRDHGRDRADDRRMHNDHDADDRGMRR